MTTPELLALIDATVAEYEASRIVAAWQGWDANRQRAMARGQADKSPAN